MKNLKQYMGVCLAVLLMLTGVLSVSYTHLEFYWLDYEHMAIDQARESYGGIRQIGRLRLVDQALALYEKIKSEMQSALSFCNNGKLTVHI